MILTEEDITEYQDLVRKRFGLEISKEEALEDALSLINFVRIAYKKPALKQLNDYKGGEKMQKL